MASLRCAPARRCAARVPVQPLSFAGLYSWACACACACSCAQVGKGDTVVSRLHEGEYFGEVALLTDQPRTASVVAVTDLMLLSLSCADLDSVLTAFPAAGARIEAAAKERLKTMARNDGIHMRRGSHGALSSLLGSLRSRSSSLRDTAPRRCTFTRRRSHGRGPASSEMGRAAQTLSSRLDGLEESERRPSLEEAMGDHAFDSSIADPRSRKLTRRGSQQAGYLRPCRGLGLWPRSATEAAHDTPRAEQCATAPVEARRAWDQGKGKSRRISVSNVASSPALADVSQPALATSLGRRRSVDAGLTFNEPRRIALASCASIGGSRRRSCSSECLRTSLDGGWDNAEDQKRRSSLCGKSRTAHGVPLSGSPDDAMQSLGERQLRRQSATQGASDADGTPPQAHTGSADGREQEELPGTAEGPRGLGPCRCSTLDSSTDDDVVPLAANSTIDSTNPTTLEHAGTATAASSSNAKGAPVVHASEDQMVHNCESPRISSIKDACPPDPDSYQQAQPGASNPDSRLIVKAHATTPPLPPRRNDAIGAVEMRDNEPDAHPHTSIEPPRELAHEAFARRASQGVRGVRQPVAKAAAKFFRERRASAAKRRHSAATVAPSSSVCDRVIVSAGNTPVDSKGESAVVFTLKAHMDDVLASKLREQSLIFKSSQEQALNQLKDLWTEMQNVSNKVNQIYSGKWM